MSNSKNRKILTGVYPGTFDPITYGHLDIIKRASKLFEKLIIGVAEDSNKSPTFTLEERVGLVNYEAKRLQLDCEIIAQPFKGLLVDFVRSLDTGIIIRGLRAASDFEYEFQLSYMNNKLAPDIETIFIPATSKGHFIASRVVKEIARLGGDVASFVPNSVQKRLLEIYGKNT